MFMPSLLGTAMFLNFLQALLQIFLIFLLQFRVGRSGINFVRLVFHFVKFLLRPFVMNPDFISTVENFLHQLRRNEIHALAVTHNQITRHYGNAADSHGNIDARQHHIPYRRWVDSFEIGGHINLRNSVEIPNASIDDQASTMGSFHHVVEKIVIHYRPVHLLAKQVHDQHIAWLEHVDGLKSIIGLGKAYEKYNLSWIEDVIPWTYTDLLKQISEQSPTPLLTGEDIYLKEPFQVLCEKHAVSKIQPDLATAGGILETHRIADMAQEYGMPMALHFAGTPVCCMANVHCAAATQNFLALEHHSLDVPWWASMVEEGTKTPIVNRGWIEVPDRPGLGVTLNENVVRQHLAPGTGYFEPTPQWDNERSWDRLWS